MKRRQVDEAGVETEICEASARFESGPVICSRPARNAAKPATRSTWPGNSNGGARWTSTR